MPPSNLQITSQCPNPHRATHDGTVSSGGESKREREKKRTKTECVSAHTQCWSVHGTGVVLNQTLGSFQKGSSSSHNAPLQTTKGGHWARLQKPLKPHHASLQTLLRGQKGYPSVEGSVPFPPEKHPRTSTLVQSNSYKMTSKPDNKRPILYCWPTHIAG